MSNIIMSNFRRELLRTDIEPRKLNEVSRKYKELLLKDLEKNVIKTEIVNTCQCGSSNLERLAKIDRFGLPFGSLICKDCGLIITSPRIKEESLSYYYEKYYHPLNYGKEHLENQIALFADGQGKKIFNILKDFLPQKKELNVLEIGTGTGNVLLEFKEEAQKNNININELGTEYSSNCIKICQKKNINVIYGNIETIVIKEKKFDVIILSHVFEHIIDLQKGIDDLKKIMNKEALLYIEVPGVMVSHKKDYYDFSFLGYLVHAHMYNFTKDTLSSLFIKNGFEYLYLNEEVEAVFIMKHINKNSKINNSYYLIMDYLEKFYLSYFFLKDAITKKFEKQNIRIETRDKEIQSLKDTIKKQNIRIETRDKEIQSLKDTIKKISIWVKKHKDSLYFRLIKYKIIELTKILEDFNEKSKS